MLEMQPGKSKAMKSKKFDSHFRKEALQAIRDIIASTRQTLQDVFITIR